MDLFGVLTMLGGLALFLYGMKVMGDALAKLAGGKLEKILEQMTSNRFKGVLLGAAVTAVIQSSSATTVMVVGFVNSGIMKLRQAIGVIMGANIGTTITAWILSLSGIEGDNFWLQLVKPSSFSPVLAVIGIIFVMFLKSEKKNDIGTILLGFAVLMFGMDTMSEAVKPLGEVEEFRNLFTAFENPVLGLLVGAFVTAVIQSSSASVGILQGMCLTGSVPTSAALPIIMGQNIGTCVTALLSAIGASKNARRASLVHLFFNLIGTIVFMSGFYLLNIFVDFAFMDEMATPAVIATIHTTFNVVTTLWLLPLAGILEKLAYIVLPKKEGEELEATGKVLDERFLERPAFAVAQCKTAICDMAKQVEHAMALSSVSALIYDQAGIDKIIEIEADVDVREDELSNYLTALSSKPLTEKDSKHVNMYTKSVIDFERISDYTKGIAYCLRKMNKQNEIFSKKATKEVETIFAATQEIVEKTIQCFVHEDYDGATHIDPLADVISNLKKTIRDNHNKRLAKGKCSVELGMALTDIVTSLERIAKHCSNIAEAEIAMAIDTYAQHQYSRNMKEGNEYYKDLVAGYTEKFALEV